MIPLAEPSSAEAAMHLSRALASLTEERLLALQIGFAETPAPTFDEGRRAGLLAGIWRDAGLHPSRDEAGNVIALRPGSREGPLLAISAHLDTVFPLDQDIRVRRPGEDCSFCGERVPEGEYHGPGIGDCAAGLACITGVLEALQCSEAATEAGILFVATVGEEAAGDLRGARALFAGEWGSRIGAFITADVGVRGAIVHETTGARRYRATFRGPGGHAWDDFGVYSPVHAAAEAVHRILAYRTPSEPRTSVNVGVFTAGRSVNAIPEEASFEVDMRSVDQAEVDRLALHARKAIESAHRDLQACSRGHATVQIEEFSSRPGGRVPRDSPLVRASVDALETEGFTARFGPGSLDANIPMAMGIPALGFPWGGSSRRAHSVRETFRNEGRLANVRALTRLAATFVP